MTIVSATGDAALIFAVLDRAVGGLAFVVGFAIPNVEVGGYRTARQCERRQLR